MLIRLSTPSGLAVSLDEAKAQLRVDAADDDRRIVKQIKAQTERYEDFTGRYMLPIDLEYRVGAWGSGIAIPAAPIREVTAVKYLDADHAEQTLATSQYYFEASDRGGDVLFTSSFESPTLSDRANPVRVEFTAGYSAAEANLSGVDPELIAPEIDEIHILMMVQRQFDGDDQMPDDEMRRKMGHRRIFR